MAADTNDAEPPRDNRRSPRKLAWLRSERLRRVALCCVLLAATGFFAWVGNEHYPLRHWLFFPYAGYWLLSLFFALSSLLIGLRLARWLFPEPPRLGERLTLAFTLGALVFMLGVFVAGLLGLFGRVFFFAWPVLLLGLGGPTGFREWRRLRRHLRRFGIRPFLPGTAVESLAAILMVISLVAIYLQVMNPLNVGGDSYWYHLPIAEHYAAIGAIRPFAEGWYLGAYPHLSSVLYAWAFQSPGDLFDHVALSSHLEWTLFLATLPGISVLTRRLLGGTRVPYAAAALFLFPGLFLYDSSLITGADHILAFWAPAMGIALIRLGRRFVVREALLVGVLLGAAILTKYHASFFFVGTSLLMVALTIKHRRLQPALVWALACLAVSSGHWLKNWVWYGDPMYPRLHGLLPLHPFHEGAGKLIYWDAQFVATGTPWEKAQKTLAAIVNYSFVPHDWDFHGARPLFGSLFTLLIPALFFLRARLRHWLLIVGVHLGIAVWYLTMHQDRYLQALVPWMAASVAATLVLAWQKGVLVRVAVTLLVALQVVWGADVYFIRTHSMIGDSPLKSLVDYLGAGQQKRYEERRRLHFGSLQPVGARLPREAKVLIHDRHDRLGLGTASVQDTLAWQGAVDYMLLETPDDVMGLWRKLGVTHLMWWHDHGGPSPEELGREAVFLRAAYLWGTSPETIDDKRLSKLVDQPSNRALSSSPTRIAWLGCGDDPPLGLYSPRGLVSRTPDSQLGEDQVRQAPLDAVASANALVIRPSCGYLSDAIPAVANQFVDVRKAGDVVVWVRK